MRKVVWTPAMVALSLAARAAALISIHGDGILT